MCFYNNYLKLSRHLFSKITMDNWLTAPVIWTGNDKNLLLQPKPNPSPPITLEQIIEKSQKFPIRFPINTTRCHFLKEKTDEATLEFHINSVYAVIHEYALLLCAKFLNHQKEKGLRNEVYAKMSLPGLIERLLSKRAVLFLNPQDQYLLISGERSSGNWENVGTDKEKEPLILTDCLSYDEIKLSALLSVSSHSFFINEGGRYNGGKFQEDRGKVEENGVIIGLIGTRFEKSNVMEHCEIVKSERQNTEDFCKIGTVQRIFSEFYGDSCKSYDELKEEMKSSDRYFPIISGYFDKLMYQKRLSISIDTLLIESNHRALTNSKKAFIHVVGLGLGVWKISDQQNQLFLDTFLRRIELLAEVLPNISHIRFAYIRATSNIDKIKDIKLLFEDKDPQEKLQEKGKLLVVSYAWDGNAHPGNEFWGGSLTGSGDPAAACSSQVAELHNWHINERLSGDFLKVATSGGLVSFGEYQEQHRGD